MLEFTKALYELFVRQGLGLSQSILVMSRKPKRDGVSRAAMAIFSALEKGNYFSNALRTCGFINFDDVYISFIQLAEKNGDLKSAVTYLKEKLEREAADKRRLVGATVYPGFVILLSVGACVFIGLYTKTADFILLVKYVLALIFVCGVVFLLIVKMLAGDRLSEAFLAVDFLLRNGIELSEAVGCAVQVAGPSCKIGNLFENARIKLSYGMDLTTAFSCASGSAFDSKLKEAFYFADLGGSKDDLFGRIAAYLVSEKDKRRTLCMSLIEPVFIAITGIFLLMLLMTFFMPLINDIGWM